MSARRPQRPRLVLRRPVPGDEDQARAAHAELSAEGFDLLAGLGDDEGFAAYLDRLAAEERGLVPADRVPRTFLVGEVDGVVVGRLSLRHRLDAWLAVAGGHVGYAVRPAHRGRGHATAMLRAALPVAAGLGLDRLLVTCAEDNPASRAVIDRCGGEPDGRTEVPGGPVTLRFWVPTA